MMLVDRARNGHGEAPHAPYTREICNYCSKSRSPREIVRIGNGGAIMCWHCLQGHQRALHVLAGSVPAGCQACGISFADLSAQRSGDTKVTMFVHWKDGLYQTLCRPCSDAYELKRADLYRKTRYGWEKKL